MQLTCRHLLSHPGFPLSISAIRSQRLICDLQALAIASAASTGGASTQAVAAAIANAFCTGANAQSLALANVSFNFENLQLLSYSWRG